MKKPIPCLILAIFLSGCFNGSTNHSAIEYARQGENSLRHFHPVHETHRAWRMAESAKTLTIRADQSRIRVSARTNPDRVIVRRGGNIVGSVEKTSDGAQFVPAGKTEPQSALTCRISRHVRLNADGRGIDYRFDDETASSPTKILKKLSRNRYSVSTKSAQNNGDTCEGIEIESPFSALGTLMFQEQGFSLEELAGYAWFVTKIQSDCLK